jgi:probable phosphoglycerate mutase
MTTTLILLRHGATAANRRRPYILQGLHPDSELVEAGRAQARAAGVALRAFQITHIYSSPLKRARDTAQAVADQFRLPVQVEPGLVEADVGEWAGLSWAEIERRWPAEYLAFRQDPEENGYVGGENLTQVRERVLPVVEGLRAAHSGECLLLVGHGVVNRVLLGYWLGLPQAQARRLPQDNAGFSRVDFCGETASVRSVNEVAHLTSLLAAA